VKASEILPGAPVRLSGDLRLAEDLVAVHGDGDPVVVPVAAASGRLGPVYRRTPGGGSVVPTGRILVRFSGGADRAAVLKAAGYDLAETVGYAPDAVWARASEGDVVGSLSHLDELTAAPEVVHAEPELLSERAWKG
jgi:hypothetical protein